MTGTSKLSVQSVVLIIAAATATSQPAYAQASDPHDAQRRAQVFVSNGATLKRLGGARSMLHFGFGMEWVHPRGLGLGFEVGPRFEDHDFMRLDDIMLSGDASYHLRSRSNPRKIDPFVNGGFSLGWEPVPDGQQTSFLSLGGGITYWLDARRGIRFELRDTVTVNEPQTGYHYLGFRVGYTWLMGPE